MRLLPQLFRKCMPMGKNSPLWCDKGYNTSVRLENNRKLYTEGCFHSFLPKTIFLAPLKFQSLRLRKNLIYHVHISCALTVRRLRCPNYTCMSWTCLSCTASGWFPGLGDAEGEGELPLGRGLGCWESRVSPSHHPRRELAPHWGVSVRCLHTHTHTLSPT